MGQPVSRRVRNGIFDIDSIQYHLPFAARFFQTGSITGVDQVRPSPAPAYFPANGELLHGVGLLVFGRDPLSPLVNFAGWRYCSSRHGVSAGGGASVH